MEGEESVGEKHRKKKNSFKKDEKGQNKEIESSSEDKRRETEEQPSPRGVLEIPVSGSDSDQSSSCLSSIDRSSSSGSEKSPVEADGGGGAAEEVTYGSLQWKKLFGQMIKKRSVRRFSEIPFLPMLKGSGELSKKAMRKRIGRNHSAEEAIDCGDFVMPKPTWKNFTYDELKRATDNFSPDKLIGKGGHAEVYKGFLSDGEVVAVKKITKEQTKDEDRVGDYLSELGIIAHIDHPNAAKLIGFSAESGLHLVLQFSPHGSLSNALFGLTEKNITQILENFLFGAEYI